MQNDQLTQAIFFAMGAHQQQIISGTKEPYFTHIISVIGETLLAYESENHHFELLPASIMAALHDTIEDTSVSYTDIEQNFGKFVADGVMALTKNELLPKDEQMLDSLNRIFAHSNEARVVKMADRINNLREPMPFWNDNKKLQYMSEAILIYEKLAGICPKIEERLAHKICTYPRYMSDEQIIEEANLRIQKFKDKSF